VLIHSSRGVDRRREASSFCRSFDSIPSIRFDSIRLIDSFIPFNRHNRPVVAMPPRTTRVRETLFVIDCAKTESTHDTVNATLHTTKLRAEALAFATRARASALENGERRKRRSPTSVIRLCDQRTAPHAFERRMRELGNTKASGGGGTWEFRATSAPGEWLRALARASDAMASYAARCVRDDLECESDDGDGDGAKRWLVNLTRNIGAATNDFERASFGAGLGAFGDDDDDGGGGGDLVDDCSVLFIVTSFPECAHGSGLDAATVLKWFKGVEERFKRDRIRAHLLFTGPEPKGAFGDILRAVFRKFHGAVLPLDAAMRLAPWVPLYSALEELSAPPVVQATAVDGGEDDANTSSESIDIVVETGTSVLRLGEARAIGSSSCDGSISVTGFIHRDEIPASSLLVETQRIVTFDDSPIRALSAMMVLKRVIASIRWDSRGNQHAGVLEPLTCSSFLITMARAASRDRATRKREPKSVHAAFEELMTKRQSFASLESMEALLAGVRDDLHKKVVSPNLTQELALTQLTNYSLASQSLPLHVDVEVQSLADAFAADQSCGVAQTASRLESWYASNDYAPNTRSMLARVQDQISLNESDDKRVKDELTNVLDARFKSMLKAHKGIVSPPRPFKAKRSLTSALMAASPGDSQANVWTGSLEDVEIAARNDYDAIVLKFTDGEDDIDPDLSEFAAKLIHRFRKSLEASGEAVSLDELVNRLESAICVSTKKLALNYIKNQSKVAKRREYLLQAHIALQLAALRIDMSRSNDRRETSEELEDRALDKKEQKKTSKTVVKLLNEITFVLNPSGLAGIVALMEHDFIPKYHGNLPGVLHALQVELGVAVDKAPPVSESSVALTPFSPAPLRRSPRKPKRPDALTYEARPVNASEKQVVTKPKDKLPHQWHHFSRGRTVRREIKVPINSKPFALPKPKPPSTSRRLIDELPLATPVPRGGNQDNARFVAATPAVAKKPPSFSSIVAETPLGSQIAPSNPLELSTPVSMSQVVRKFPSLTGIEEAHSPAPTKRTHAIGALAPPDSAAKRSRLSGQGAHL